MSEKRLKNIYYGMKQRCCNPNRPNYRYYGGRGITICDEWLNSFQAFSTWSMDNGYQEGLSIDRIDYNGNYEPSNCRWVSMKEQAANKRPRNTQPLSPQTFQKQKRIWSNTGAFGVTYDKKAHRYRVYSRRNYLGSCKSLQEAIAIREQAEKEVHMANNEKELINLIRNNKDPEKALVTAINILTSVIGSDEEA